MNQIYFSLIKFFILFIALGSPLFSGEDDLKRHITDTRVRKNNIPLEIPSESILGKIVNKPSVLQSGIIVKNGENKSR